MFVMLSFDLYQVEFTNTIPRLSFLFTYKKPCRIVCFAPSKQIVYEVATKSKFLNLDIELRFMTNRRNVPCPFFQRFIEIDT